VKRPIPADRQEPEVQSLSRKQDRNPKLSIWLTLCAAILLGFALLLRLLTLHTAGFDADEYAFALVGRDVLLGKLPYTGIFDNKPVGLNYLFAAALRLGGQSVGVLHALGLLAAALGAWLVARSARAMQAPAAVTITLAALFLLEMLWLGGWATMSEVVAAPLLALANHWVITRPDGRRGLFLAVGLVAGLACQITWLAAPGFGLMTLGLMISGRPRPWAARFMEGVIAALGLAAAIFAVWLPQIVSGNWPAYMREQLAYHGHYRLPPPPGWLWRENFFLPVIVLGVPLGAVMVIQLWNRALTWPSRAFWIVALQLAGALIAACASNRLYTHYLILALPAYAVLPAVIARDSERRLWAPYAAALLLCGAVAAALPLPYLMHHLNGGDADQEAAAYIASHSAPDRPILVFNASHAIYFHAQRSAVTRYVFPTHYIASCAGGETEISTAAYLEAGLRAHPALLAAGVKCAVDLDVSAVARQHGYEPVHTVDQVGERITIYAPQVQAITPGAALPDPSASR